MNFKSRNFEFILYPEDSSHMRAFDVIRFTYSYLACLHDKDIESDGKPKKIHYHVLVCGFKNPVWSSSLCKDLNINECYCSQVHNLRSACRYLIHLDERDKFHYSPDSVEGTYLDYFQKSCESKLSKDDILNDIFDFINSCSYCTLHSLYSYCSQNFYLAVYKQFYLMLKDLLIEHNSLFSHNQKYEDDFSKTKKIIDNL